MGLVFRNNFVFIDEERNVTDILAVAVSWAKANTSVDVTFKNHQLGKLKFLGEVETADDMKDGNFAEVYFVKDEKCYYINTPTDEELESLPVSNVTRVGNNVLIA